MNPTTATATPPTSLGFLQLLKQELVDIFGGQLYGNVTKPMVSPSTAAVLIGNILQIAFGFLAIVFIIMVLYAGFEWMTSQGDEEKIKKHKTALIHATLGLILALLAFSFTRFFGKAIFGALGIQ